MAVSVRDVAAVAAVSVGTVERAQPPRQGGAGDRRAGPGSDREPRVRPQRRARQRFGAGRSRSIGLVVLDIREPVLHRHRARGRGAGGREGDDAARRQQPGELRPRRGPTPTCSSSSGSAAFCCRRSPILEPAGTVAQQRIPWFSLTASPRTTPSSVAVDDVVGGRLAVRHLVDVGRLARLLMSAARPRSARSPTGSSWGLAGGAPRRRGRAEVVQTDALTVLAGRAAGERSASAVPKNGRTRSSRRTTSSPSGSSRR